MELLSSVFSKIVSRIAVISSLILFCFTIIAYGENWGVGLSYPLLPLHCRILVITSVLLSALVLYFRLPRYFLVGLLSLTLVWVMGPLISLGESRPLASFLTRSLLCVALIILVGGYYLFTLAIQTYGALPQRLAALPFIPQYRQPRYPTLTRTCREWRKKIAKLKSQTPFYRRLLGLSSKDETHSCILIIGPTSSGKTSALLHSEPAFTFPTQQKAAHQQVKSTEHCSFWLTDNVLWCDTPGRYFEPENLMTESVDEWDEVAQHLVAMRRVARVDAATLVIDCPRLLASTPQQLMEYAALCRANIRSLQQQTQRTIPVFLFISQIDHLIGFQDYFHEQTFEERQQLFGIHIEPPDINQNLDPQRIRQQLNAWIKRIEQQVLGKQHRCENVVIRKGIERFPANFAALIQRLITFIEHLAPPPHESIPFSEILLPGIYAGCSEQCQTSRYANPQSLIQQWQGTTYALSSTAARPKLLGDDDNEAEALSSSSRAYFLKTFFQQCVLGECRQRQWGSKKHFSTRITRGVAYSSLVGLSVVFLYGLTRSYQYNQGYLTDVHQRLNQFEQQINASPITLDLALSKLSNLTLPRNSERQPSFFSIGHWGLYTPNKWAESVNAVYDQWLIDQLLPRLEEMAAQRLDSELNGQDPQSLFTTLRVYLMLHGKLPKDAGFLAQWFLTGTTQLSIFDSQANAARHIRRLMQQVSWQPLLDSIDGQRVDAARRQLLQRPLATYLYQQILRQLTPAPLPALDVSQLITSSYPLLFTYQGEVTPLAGIFTVSGAEYWDNHVYAVEYPVAWVTVEQTLYGEQGPLIRDPQRIAMRQEGWQQTTARYLTDYRQHWQRFLSGIHFTLPMTAFSSPANSQRERVEYLLKDFTQPDSQLRQLLVNIARQTQLSKVESDDRRDPISSSKGLLSVEDAQQRSELVDQHFSALHRFVDPPTATTAYSLTQLEGALTQLYLKIQATGMTTRRQLQSLISGQQEVSSLSPFLLHLDQLPQPLPQLLGQLFSVAQQQVAQQTWAINAQQIDQDIIRFCRQHLMGRYPFAKSGKDADPQAISEMFSPQGKLARYFTQHLADKVNTQARPWRFISDDQSISPRRLTLFERGAKLQRLLFPQTSQRLSLDLSLTVKDLASGITQLIIDNDDQQFRYVHGPIIQQTLGLPALSSTANFQLRALAAEGRTLWKVEQKGYWGLLRWLEKSQKQFIASKQQTLVTEGVGTQQATIAIEGLGASVPGIIRLFRDFDCSVND